MEPYKIVLIDDDPISHLINTKLLAKFAACRVETFTDPVQALKQMRWRAAHEPHTFPDVILLDIDMPHMDGWQFLNEFEKLPQEVLRRSSVIMLSSSNHFSDIEKSRQYSIVKDFFSKPLSEEMIKTMTRSAN